MGALHVSADVCKSSGCWCRHLLNDAGHQTGDPNGVEEGLSTLVTALYDAAAAARMLLPSVFLVLPPGAKTGRLNENLKQIVHPSIRRLAAARKVQLVDPRLPPADSYKTDMVHLTSKGARRVAQRLAASIQASE